MLVSSLNIFVLALRKLGVGLFRRSQLTSIGQCQD
jgi:hypothetical protein